MAVLHLQLINVWYDKKRRHTGIAALTRKRFCFIEKFVNFTDVHYCYPVEQDMLNIWNGSAPLKAKNRVKNFINVSCFSSSQLVEST